MPICDHDCARFKFRGLTWGEFRVDDADLPQAANGGTGLNWSDFTPGGRGNVWFLVDIASGSDYAGELLHKSNFRSLLRACYEALADADTCQEPWFIELSGGYSTFGIVLHCERTPESVYEIIEHTDGYPVVDEQDMGELEMEETQIAWDNWAKQDFRRALEDKFPNHAIDSVSDDDLYQLFHDTAEHASVYWEVDGMSMHIRISSVVEEIDASDLPISGWSVDNDLDGLKNKRRRSLPAWVRRT